jgi:hypothetical protein
MDQLVPLVSMEAQVLLALMAPLVLLDSMEAQVPLA